MDSNVKRLVALKPETVIRREAAARAKLAEMQRRQLAAEERRDYVFAAQWSQLARTTAVELNYLVAARQIQSWAR
jgi:hypothetical protein